MPTRPRCCFVASTLFALIAFLWTMLISSQAGCHVFGFGRLQECCQLQTKPTRPSTFDLAPANNHARRCLKRGALRHNHSSSTGPRRRWKESEVSAHYNRHAELGSRMSKSQMLQDRREGNAYPLKRYHNQVKLQLLRYFAKEFSSRRAWDGVPLSILDVGCGRACDMHKWAKTGVQYALGIDASSVIIDEARRRYESQTAEQPPSSHGYGQNRYPLADFLCSASFGTRSIQPLRLKGCGKHSKGIRKKIDETGGFVLATSMFAFHYFFASEKSARQAVNNIANALRPGGRALFVFPDGNRIQTLLKLQESKHGDEGKVYSSEVLELKANWSGVPPKFGAGYYFALKNTVTEKMPYEGNTTASAMEFLVDPEVLTGLAGECGLQPVSLEKLSFSLLEGSKVDVSSANQTQRSGCFMLHFAPPFRESHPELAQASCLYAVMAFERV